RGGIEKGEEHYKWFVILHGVFFLSLLCETLISNVQVTFNYFLFVIFLTTQIARVWCIQTLGKFWNTKIIVLPRVALIRKGPYKLVNNRNIFFEAFNLLIFLFLFGSYIPAFVFQILNELLFVSAFLRRKKH